MWTYSQSSGRLTQDGVLVANGYAGGNLGQNPEGRNNPNLQFVHNIGPLPQGSYTIGPPREGTHLGPYALPLTPNPANQMHTRSGFYIHGDRAPTFPPYSASEGCIVVSYPVRVQIWKSGDHKLDVIE